MNARSRRPSHGLLLGALLLLVSSTGLSTGLALTQEEELAPKPEFADTLEQIRLRLDYVHYRRQKLDDDLSSRLLDEYVQALDPSKFYLTARDVASFETYREKLDDAIQQQDSKPAYVIFRRFQERREALWQSMIDRVNLGVDKLSFEDEEWFELDRELESWPRNDEELTRLWSKRFKNDVLNLRLADQEAEEIKTTLLRRYENQLRRVHQVKSLDVFRIFCNVYAALYCPHTEYYPPLDAENFDIRMSLSFEGIGALLGTEDEYIKIERILPGGPAEAGGELMPGDRIVSVAQDTAGAYTDVIGWRTDEAVELIRGEKGTMVRLMVLPANETDTSRTKEIKIVRDEVKLEEQEAQSRILEVGDGAKKRRIGVIVLEAFYMDFDAARRGDLDFKSSTRDVERLVEELKKEKVDGIVVDLRNNGGGSLTEAHDLTGLFLGRAPVVQIRDTQGRVEVLSAERDRVWGGPLAVMVNRLSASASEIFAGAVQDTGRGLVLGTPTYGKGTVQNLLQMDQGQLKITLAKFYRISGASTQHRGVLPDILFPSVFDAEEIGESALDHALEWDHIDAIKGSENDHSLRRIQPELLRLHGERTKDDPEFSFLRERFEFSRGSRSETRLSLSESARRAEREEDEATLLAMENRRRVGIGLEPIASWDDEDPNEETEEREDPLVLEAARILADAIALNSL